MYNAQVVCDQTGEILADGVGPENRIRPYITLNGGIALQLMPGENGTNLYGEPVPFAFITEQHKRYAFRDAQAFADWIDSQIKNMGLTPLKKNEKNKRK